MTSTSTIYHNKLISNKTYTVFGFGYRKKTYETKKRQTGVRYGTWRHSEITAIVPF